MRQSTWRGIWLVGLVWTLVLLGSCSKQPAPRPPTPDTRAAVPAPPPAPAPPPSDTSVVVLSQTPPQPPNPIPAPLSPQLQALEQTYQAGRVAFKEQRYDDAAAQFSRVVATDPEDLKARLNWAAALSAGGNPAEAIVQCQNVLARDPANAEAYYQWGAALARMGRHQEAVEKFDQALALKPMAALLQDDPTLQRSLQGYLQRQRRQAQQDTTVIRSKPATQQ